ncbi:MAG: DUF6498-containing protein [Candidatus Ranarchaeia archaeon]|jgi:hypothetical protein
MESTTATVKKYTSLIILIIMNLGLFIYSLFFSTTFEVLIVFWVESAVVAFYNVLKMATTGWQQTHEFFSDLPIGAVITFIFRLVMIGFFLVHFSLFMFAHLFFINFLFGPQSIFTGGDFLFDIWTLVEIPDVSGPFAFITVLGWVFIIMPFNAIRIILVNLITPEIYSILWFPIILMVLSHGYSFVTNYIGKKEYKTGSARMFFTQPYSRIFAMQFAVIFGAFALFAIPYGIIPILILGPIKLVADLIMHLLERKKFAKIPEEFVGRILPL